jgi:hypothetical protein
LWFDLPATYRLLVAGEISEYVASLVVTETRHLDAETRREVDAKISAAGISRMGPRSAAACAREHDYEADPEGYVQRGRTERKNCRVTLRPAPGTMSVLSGCLPAEHGVACLKALRERGNYAREMPGWNVEAISSGLDGRSHIIKITTPTVHTYLSDAP